MAIFASFVHCLPNILQRHTTAFTWCDCMSMTLASFFGDISRLLDFSHQISRKRCVIRQKLLYTTKSHTSFRLVPLLMTLKYIWRSLRPIGCHFHIHFNNLWHAFASRGLQAMAELLVTSARWYCDASCLFVCLFRSFVRSLTLNQRLHKMAGGRWACGRQARGWAITSHWRCGGLTEVAPYECFFF